MTKERCTANTKQNKAKAVALARESYEKDGEIEFDDAPAVSFSPDNGAYVQAWVWVDFADTSLDKEPNRRRPRHV